jgi:hypothetical protein
LGNNTRRKERSGQSRLRRVEQQGGQSCATFLVQIKERGNFCFLSVLAIDFEEGDLNAVCGEENDKVAKGLSLECALRIAVGLTQMSSREGLAVAFRGASFVFASTANREGGWSLLIGEEELVHHSLWQVGRLSGVQRHIRRLEKMGKQGGLLLHIEADSPDLLLGLDLVEIGATLYRTKKREAKETEWSQRIDRWREREGERNRERP